MDPPAAWDEVILYKHGAFLDDRVEARFQGRATWYPGVVAGACGLSAVVSTLVYKGVCAGRYRSSTLLLVAEVRWITPSPPSPSHTHADTHGSRGSHPR